MGKKGEELEGVLARAQLMRESLNKSQNLTDNMLRVLGSFNQRLSSLQTTMHPMQVRIHCIRRAHDNIDQTISAAEAILTQFDVSRQVEPKIVEGPQENLSAYLGAVDQLKTNVDFFNFHRSFQASDAAFKHARALLLKAMVKLEEKFREILTQHSKPLDPEGLLKTLPSSMRPINAFGASGESQLVEKVIHAGSGADNAKDAERIPTLPVVIAPKVIPQLADMAQRMVHLGYHQQCIRAYREIRSTLLESCLRKLGVEKATKEDVQKLAWEELETKIANWIRFMKISVKLLFAAERKACDQVFYHLDPHREICLVELLDPNFTTLMSFGDAVAKSRRSPEKFFVLLDMYDSLRNLLPEIDIIFSGEAATPLRDYASVLCKRLAVAAKDTFEDFLEAVEKDSTKTAVQDGTVHPLTCYIVYYIKFIFVYQNTIRELYEDKNIDNPQSRLGQNVMKIMANLQINLDAKAKQYKDPALMSVFLMNNVHYIVRQVKDSSEAKDLLGADWIQRHRRIVQQHASAYQRAAWGKAFQSLSGLSSSSSGSLGANVDTSGVPRSLVKERFKAFNSTFEELHQKQSQWSIPDTELREAVRLAVAEVLLPAYRSFLKRYGTMLEGGKNPQKYIKYTPEDLESLLSEFFEGKARKSQLFQT